MTGETLTDAGPAPRAVPEREHGGRSRARLWVVLGVLAAFAVEVAAILVTTGGHFTYTLDDPYIHLALADHIRHGHYGINPAEPASPSSSALWPFLLSVTAGLPFQDWVPLLWNLLFTVGSVLVLHDVLAARLRGWRLATVLTAAVLGLNLVGLAFTGLEHSLQVLLALLVGRGVVRVYTNGRVDRLLVAGMVLGPLVRYEDAAFSAAAALVLVAVGRTRVAVAVTAVWVTLLGAFSLFLVAQGLDPLPSSVLAKSTYATSHAPLLTAGVQLLAAVRFHPAFLVYLLVPIVDVVARRRWTALQGFMVAVLVAHGVAGGFGWFGRYEIYLLAGLSPVAVEIVAGWQLVWSRRLQWAAVAVAALGLASISPYVECTAVTPMASADVWHQQAQTARFVRDYWAAPVAVNDLGLVSYRGGQRVLDLWGLASQEARRQRVVGTRHWVGPMVRRHRIRLAAVYPQWFVGQIPGSWVHVATLVGGPPVTAAYPDVAFYATRRDAVAQACAALTRFRAHDADARVDLAAACSR